MGVNFWGRGAKKFGQITPPKNGRGIMGVVGTSSRAGCREAWGYSGKFGVLLKPFKFEKDNRGNCGIWGTQVRQTDYYVVKMWYVALNGWSPWQQCFDWSIRGGTSNTYHHTSTSLLKESDNSIDIDFQFEETSQPPLPQQPIYISLPKLASPTKPIR